MTISEIAQHVATEGAALIRISKDQSLATFTTAKGSVRRPINYDIKPLFTGNKRGWIIMDSFTASMLVAVYESLTPGNRQAFDALKLPTLLDLGWKRVK